ncbi:MAG: nucleotidyltransferase domain-containing protein [Planctomycetaceae bacterium]|jgi:predicted nucleotidyltransferase|nr:nucleotidyltransferase domain-containing protein [Planctomycetaceae bacterium]
MDNLNKIPKRYQKDIKTAVDLLKNEGCKSVYLFGSMVTGKIHDHSDIDIGIKGLPAERFFSVYSKLYGNLSTNIDLVDFDFDTDFFSLLNELEEIIEIG